VSGGEERGPGDVAIDAERRAVRGEVEQRVPVPTARERAEASVILRQVQPLGVVDKERAGRDIGQDQVVGGEEQARRRTCAP